MFIGRLILLFASATTAFAAVAAPASKDAEKANAAEATNVVGTLQLFGSEFIATYTIDGIARTFEGFNNAAFPGTTSTTSTLSFTDDNQLVGGQSYTGTVSTTTVNVDLSLGATITWDQEPHVFPPKPIAGSGSWF